MLDLRLLCGDMKDPASPLCREARAGIRALYALLRAPSPQTADMLDGWREDFRSNYGDPEASLTGNRRLDPAALLAQYDLSLEEGMTPEGQVQLLFFAIQTWFSLLLKWLLAEVLEGPDGPAGERDILLGLPARRRGIENCCAPDWFCWPVFELSRGAGAVCRALAGQVARYRAPLSPAAFVRENDHDYIKQLYEALIPAALRHALGEYYTPDWLAELTLRQAAELWQGGAGTPRLLDPTCGSGTFLLRAIRRRRQAGLGLADILATTAGFDINPLAVLTARTNYLFAVLDLLPEAGPVSLPVYTVDLLCLDGEAAPAGPPEALETAAHPARVIRAAAAREREQAARAERADLVVGNPPWVNWEYLPEEYRRRSEHLWGKYGLFSARGRQRSFAKEDISLLITCLAADRLLKPGGLLALVLRQAMFKSAQNGADFRRLFLGGEGKLGVLRVEDLSGIRVFENVSAAAALLFARAGEATTYPVPYGLWSRRPGAPRGGIHTYAGLEAVLTQVERRAQLARPCVADDPASPWSVADPAALSALSRVLGSNAYQARTGVFTGGANGVYWLRVLGREGGLLRVANVTGRARRPVRPVCACLEPDYVFPLVRGCDLEQWRVRPELWLLCPHTARTRQRPVPGALLARQAPATYAYLSSFRPELDGRRGFAGWEREIQRQEFHAILRVGEYTFAPYKVAWRYIASRFLCAVLTEGEDPWLGRKQYLPNEKLMYVALWDEGEAYYLCGLLSSAPVARCVGSYMNPTSISAHVLRRLYIPPYDPGDPRHRRISALCRAGHRDGEVAPRLGEIDRLAADLYGLAPEGAEKEASR